MRAHGPDSYHGGPAANATINGGAGLVVIRGEHAISLRHAATGRWFSYFQADKPTYTKAISHLPARVD